MPGVRNLLYHVYPVRGNGTWQRNLDQLKKRWALFTGQKIIAVATDDRCDPPEAVRDYLGQDDVEWIVRPNDPGLGEVVTWRDLWGRLDGRPGMTFYAHAKGVKHPVNPGVGVHRWVDVMYRSCLDYLPFVEDLLRRHPIAGSFKKLGRGFAGSVSEWHYSGTFYWVRTDAGIEMHRRLDRMWAGTEAWPGVAFDQRDGAVIFMEGMVGKVNLYLLNYMRSVIEPAFKRWQAAHRLQMSVPCEVP